MTSPAGHTVFERISDRQPFASTGIRPGGLDLTLRGLTLAGLELGDSSLDVGCGTGVTVEYLIRRHSIRAVGIDTSIHLVSRGKAGNAALPLFLGDAETLPFAAGSFDGVFLECTLSLVPSVDKVLKECHRVLNTRGRIVVSDVYARNPEAVDELKNLPVRSCLRGALDKDRFLQECFTAGFESVRFEDHSDLLKDFAVQLIWTYGSLNLFWNGQTGCSPDCGQVRGAAQKAWPGYFLLVGFKDSEIQGDLRG